MSVHSFGQSLHVTQIRKKKKEEDWHIEALELTGKFQCSKRQVFAEMVFTFHIGKVSLFAPISVKRLTLVIYIISSLCV